MTCKSEFNPIWTLSTWFRKSDCCSKALKWGICRVMQRKISLSHQKQQGICFLGRSEGILWRPPLKSTDRYWSNLPSLLLKSGSTGVQLLIPWYAYGLIRTHSDGIPRTCACWRLCCTAQQTFYIFDEHHQAYPSAGCDVVALFTLGLVSFLVTFNSISLTAALHPHSLVLCALICCLDLPKVLGWPFRGDSLWALWWNWECSIRTLLAHPEAALGYVKCCLKFSFPHGCRWYFLVPNMLLVEDFN